MGGDYRAVIREDHENSKPFKEIFGRMDVPIINPNPEITILNGISQYCYFVDINALNAQDLQHIVDFISYKFGALEDEVRASLDYYGLPLRADRVLCVIGNPVGKF